MTYDEFMNWVQTDEELKEKFDRLLGERITKDGIERILQPDTIKSIGKQAFKGCVNLQGVKKDCR